MEFFIRDQHYSLCASYTRSGLSESEIELLDNKIAVQINFFAKNIIDCYLGK